MHTSDVILMVDASPKFTLEATNAHRTVFEYHSKDKTKRIVVSLGKWRDGHYRYSYFLCDINGPAHHYSTSGPDSEDAAILLGKRAEKLPVFKNPEGIPSEPKYIYKDIECKVALEWLS